MMRKYFPKGTNFSNISDKKILKATNKINYNNRKLLKNKSAAETLKISMNLILDSLRP